MDSDFCRNIIESAKRQKSQPVMKKKPITTDIIRSILDIQNKKDANLKNLRIAALCYLAFAGFFRYDELCNIVPKHCLISNQRIRLCLENVLFGILTENACPLLQLLNYFIIIGKLYLWDCRSKQILPNIYGFRAKIIAKYETEEKISNKEFFKRKWILTPYLS